MPKMSNSRWMLAPLLLPMIPLAASAATITVPLQQPTIQAAINAALAGDVIEVSPGTYNENINFNGKAITVTAVRSPRPAIINGRSVGPVAIFATGEGSGSVLSGFVLENGSASSSACFGEGGGVCISNSSPTIEYNTIKNNVACSGGGVAIYFGSPLITGNLIENNAQGACSGGIGGGGISVDGAAKARITNNIIENNSMGSADGGGISLFAAGTPTITGNIIRGNSAGGESPCASGGGITMENESDATIVGNQITSNTAGCGAGVNVSVPSGGRGPYLINNTISDNPGGAAIYSTGFVEKSKIINNLIVGSSGQNALYCDGTYDTNPPVIQFDDIFGESGGAYGGVCTDQTGKNGNISVDPLFVSASTSNYHITIGSPAIDAGSNSAPNLPTTDFDGQPRIQDGNLDGTVTVDMGIDEFRPTSAAAPTDLSANEIADHRSARVAHAPALASGRIYQTSSGFHRTVYAYDASGKVISETDANGVKHKMK